RGTVAGRTGDTGVNEREEPVAEHGGPQKIKDFLGKEGARERPELLPWAEAEGSGLCDDAADAERCFRGTVAGRTGDTGVSAFLSMWKADQGDGYTAGALVFL
ncbi:RusA family crossover junction endodeoxyribonuclease, partial [Dysosmobacter welbionis]